MPRRTRPVTPGQHFAAQQQAWRQPAQAVSLWEGAASFPPEVFAYTTRGAWWDLLEELGLCVVCSREYENLLIGLSVVNKRPLLTYWPLPHPSGIAVSPHGQGIWVASTRNPNQLVQFCPSRGYLPRCDKLARPQTAELLLLPVSSQYFPGGLYFHDLAFLGDRLHANAVGCNAIAAFNDRGGYTLEWWPRCLDGNEHRFAVNYLQLNSIAAGPDLAASFFSASTDHASARRPGHRNFPVDRKGVIYSGATREVVARGLTRPHSARLLRGEIWVNNSGYGQLGLIESGGFTPVATLPGWTRGLCFHGQYALVGSSRVIQRFKQYAPGVDVEKSRCGLHFLDVASGKVLGSLFWEYGNQIFAVELLPVSLVQGFPLWAGGKGHRTSRTQALFYSFDKNAMLAGEDYHAE